MRKSPIRHTVKSHKRGGKQISSFTRGKGKKSQRSKKVVVGYRQKQTPYNKDGTIVLWHGSPTENAQSILKHGLIPPSGNFSQRTQEGVDAVCKYLKLSPKQCGEVKRFSHLATERQLEAEELGGVVYVSGEKAYAMSNALAGKEWLGEIYRWGEHQKFNEYFEARSDKFRREQAIIKKLDMGKPKMQEALSRAEYDEYKRLSGEENRLMTEMRQVSDDFRKEWKSYGDNMTKMRRDFLGMDATVFKIRMPVKEFKKLAKTKHTKNRIEIFEDRFQEYLRGENPKYNWFSFMDERIAKGESVEKFGFFSEMHLSKIEPKYIVGSEKFDKSIPSEQLHKYKGHGGPKL